MFKWLIWILFCGLSNVSFAQKIQLSPPKANVQMAMLSKADPQNLVLDFRMESATIRYTLDGNEPTLKSKRYQRPLKINKPCIIKAKAFHHDFDPSETVTATFMASGKKMLNYIVSEPNPKYADEGSKTLFDGQFGNMSYTKNYLGYDKGPAEITFQPDIHQFITTIHISYLTNQGAWIFGPFKISVFDENNKLLIQNIFDDCTQKQASNHAITTLTVPKTKYNNLKLVIEPVASIPDWHDGRGQLAWFFVDEVWVE
ncbi:MAG: chitobiase/beta-hexosaminidase C-terminal domain-containing protein [Saprospiraceae bacterium]|nr:chitobiase/beta-hexosaminidase C-terminal domain-containing protein [Saprospiraceae bacterium]MBP6568264.1 chitobiase/beta-hexosaminidase C-terminal domain-containing protein [Saprospiraceae bacterium]